MELEDILSQVNKPGRYIGGEWNAARKDFDAAAIKFALCFPDLYEVGMSNLGIRILYGILNGLSDVICDRFFSCAGDLEALLRKNNLELFSLESKRHFKEFDIIGFSLGYELSYTNVLNMLELGGIPFKASERNQGFPLIIAGGPCVMNPEPLHEFFDLFVIGEAEEVILEIIDTYRRLKHKFKAGQIDKQELLTVFAGIEGIYVPSLYEVLYADSAGIKEFRPKYAGIPFKIRKRVINDLNNAYFPLDWVVPYIQIIHDRVGLEVMRGCPNTCRFCQAKSLYFPYRLRKTQNILNMASSIYERTGYEEAALCGLSVSDHSHIENLLEGLIGLYREHSISVSLPSIKPKLLVGNLSSLIATIKKTGLTFAPEAATARLRNALGKDFDEDSFYKVIEQAYASGYQRIKLYFMIGLPGETETDLDAIAGFAEHVSVLRKKTGKPRAQVNISINALIPKPHTPFQWFKMEPLESIKQKQDYLRKKIKSRKIKLTLHNPYMSFTEAVLSRGDRRLSSVILEAFKNGAKFDAWEDSFYFEKWMNAFNECGLDPLFYLQEKAQNEFLPWDFLDIGITRETLRNEFEKLIAVK